MHVFRNTYDSPVYQPASYSTKKGVNYVRFRKPRSGEFVTGRLLPNGKARVEQRTYCVYLGGKKVSLHETDEAAAKRKAARMMLNRDEADDERAEEHRATPLTTHIEEYKLHREANGLDQDWIDETDSILRRICLACGFYYGEELSSKMPKFNRYLLNVQKTRSYRTRNKALHTMRAFVHWMIDDGRTDRDPFRKIKNLNESKCKRRRLRRVLTQDQFWHLLDTTALAPVRKYMAGFERAVLYASAATTGLRADELAQLKVKDLVLTVEVPYFDVPAGITKNGQPALCPIHPALVPKLRQHIHGRPCTSPLFNLYTPLGNIKQTARLIQSDLKRAKIPYTTEEGVADFHALRTTYITNVCRLTDQFTAMKLARHSKATLTAKHYDKVSMAHKANVVAALPLLKS